MLIDYLIQDPYNKYMDFAPALFHIPFMDTIITDTHFGLSILPLSFIMSSHIPSFNVDVFKLRNI